MLTNPSPITIAASAFLAGIAFRIFAFLSPDLVETLRDLRRPQPFLPDDRTSRIVEKAIATRIYLGVSILAFVSIVVGALVFGL